MIGSSGGSIGDKLEVMGKQYEVGDGLQRDGPRNRAAKRGWIELCAIELAAIGQSRQRHQRIH